MHVQASDVRERRQKLDRLFAWIQRERVDAACLTRPVTVAYLTGFHSEPHERLMALVLRDGAATLLVPGLERQNAEATVEDVRVVGWTDETGPFDALAPLLGGVGRLAVEKAAMSLLLAEQVRDASGARELVDVGEEVLRARAVKSASELELMARAAELTDAVLEAAVPRLGSGLRELEMAALIDAEMARLGSAPAFATAVQSGSNSAMPHLGPTGRTLQGGELLLLDLGATAAGFCGDITRVFVAGEPDPRQRDVHAIVLEAHDRAIDAVRAGAPVSEVDAAARQVIERAGFGAAFIHRTGHGLGLEAHEGPSLTATSDVRLEPGMVVTIEPGVYLEGWGGIRIEDDVVVEESGARVLTNSTRELRPLR